MSVLFLVAFAVAGCGAAPTTQSFGDPFHPPTTVSSQRPTATSEPGSTPQPTPTSSAPPTTSAPPTAQTTRKPLPGKQTTGAPPPVTHATTPPPPFVPGQAELRGALLTSNDVPAGLTAQDVSTSDVSISGCPAWDTNPPNTSASAAILFSDQGTGEAVGDTLIQAGGGGAADALSQIATMPTACHHFTATISGVTFDFTTDPLSFPTIGDGTIAVRITTRTSDNNTVVAYEDAVAIRHHDTLILVTYASSTTDIGQTTSLADKAFARVSAKW
jgi:hypothetical protein